ncbi:TIGR02710 family CRISPR-associated CARF protein [Alteribacter natronophilus]|uniref:TIGR02710 family CRISPR-associated CARF protein n=1 Tax=Alteribacter natronophilus TaxID=2583810 RepID=UPI001485D737|nr:TIGR02710 family CRISPR-associated CARF protein [Alteribacter natronophilus]
MSTFKSYKEQYVTKINIDRSESQAFYDKYLLPDVCESFVKKVSEQREQEPSLYSYDYLITTVGFDISSSIMWIKALQPKNVLFLCSRETLHLVDRIVEETSLKVIQVAYEVAGKKGGRDVYRKISEYIQKKKITPASYQRVAIDITGGKKSVVSGSTLAANHLGIDIIYIDNNGHFPGHKSPQPGKEEPSILEDPLAVFGDREKAIAISKFNSEDFENAVEYFKRIQERVFNPRPYEAYEHFAAGYAHYESMEFAQASGKLERAVSIADMLEINDIPVYKIKEQLSAMKPLMKLPDQTPKDILTDEETYWHLSAYMFEMANHYMKRGKYDLTALLTYRALEMILQHLLLVHNIYFKAPDYSPYDETDLLRKMNDEARRVFTPFRRNHQLPKRITLMQGLLLLKALDDPIIRNIDVKVITDFIELRNKSRLAHGFDVLDEGKVEQFFYRIKQINNLLWNKNVVYKKQYNSFNEFSKTFAFLNIHLPNYYLGDE